MEQLTIRLMDFWKQQGAVTRALLIGVPVLLIGVGAAAIAMLSHKPVPMQLLFGDLEEARASAVVAYLEKEGVDYQLTNEGHDIWVPVDVVYKQRNDIIASRVIDAKVGYEIFDKQQWGVTESEQEINMLRAKQGELARTFKANPAVADASVLLNPAPKSSFIDQQEDGSATVQLTMQPGVSLDASQVEGIVSAVCGATGSIPEEKVTVIDQFGHLLSGGKLAAAGSGLQISQEQREYQLAAERDMAGKIKQVLGSMYGEDKVQAVVSLDMDFNQRKTQSENYSPVVGDSGIERSLYEKRSKSHGSSEAPEEGVPGTPSNLPGYSMADGKGGGAATDDSDYETKIDYEINKQVSEEVDAPGAIKRRSASITIETDNWDVDIENKVVAMAATAIGADLTGGDMIQAQAHAPVAAAGGGEAGKAFKVQQRQHTVSVFAGWGVALLMLGLLAVLARSLVGQLMPREPLLAGMGDSSFRGGVELDHELGGADDSFVLKHLDDLSDNQTQKLRGEIERLIDSRPDMVASLVRNWLLED